MKIKSEARHEQRLETVRVGRNVCFLGGGSSPAPAPQQLPPTSSTVTQTNLPAYLEPYVTRDVAAAEAAAGQPYQAYGGQRIAGFNPNQQQT